MSELSEGQTTRIDASRIQNYADFRIDNRFTTDGGVVVMPLAGREPGHKLIRLHGGIGMRHVRWRAERAGQPPIIPRASDTGGDTLLGTSINAPLPSPNQQVGGYDWQMSGEYTYVQNDPRSAGTDTFPTGNYPFVVQPAADLAATTAGPFMELLVNPAPPGENKLDLFINVMAQIAPIVDGSFAWPFTAHPAILSSDHLIEG